MDALSIITGFACGIAFGSQVQREIDFKRREKPLMDRIQAPQVVQDRVTYEELSKLPTPEGPGFENDEEFNRLKAGIEN